jgi:hypothetical protein
MRDRILFLQFVPRQDLAFRHALRAFFAALGGCSIPLFVLPSEGVENISRAFPPRVTKAAKNIFQKTSRFVSGAAQNMLMKCCAVHRLVISKPCR